MYQHKAPHRDWQPGPGYLDLYEDIDLPEPETLFTDHWGKGYPARVADMTIAQTLSARDLKLVPPEGLTPEQLAVWNAAYEPRNEAFRKANLKGDALVRWKYQRYVKDYLRCVASMDDQIGRVLDYLDRSGLAENTIVIYASDQGFFLGEHGWFDKRWIYRESAQTPLVMRWPGTIQPGSVSDEIVGLIDLAPTLLEAAGVSVPEDIQGESLIPLLGGEVPKDWRTGWYYHYYEHPGSHNVHRHYGIVTKDFTLAHFYEPEVDSWEMYDHHADPDHRKSVHADPAYAAKRRELEAQLAALQKELDVPPVDPPGSWPPFRTEEKPARYK
jgi:arylsulfatase A-like enzyme